MKKRLSEEKIFEIKGILSEARDTLIDTITKELPKDGDFIELDSDNGYTALAEDPLQVNCEGVPRTRFFNRIENQKGTIYVSGVFDDEYADSEDGIEDFKDRLEALSLNILEVIVGLIEK